MPKNNKIYPHCISWKYAQGKYEPFNENADPRATGDPLRLVNGILPILLRAICPFCGGDFSVDYDYCATVTNIVHCPMCSMEIYIFC